jgi:hypothetical protein
MGCGIAACERAPLSVDQVIEQYTKAMGGRAAIEAVKSIEVELHITTHCALL